MPLSGPGANRAGRIHSLPLDSVRRKSPSGQAYPPPGSPEADAQELALVAAIQRGEQGAWSELLRRYQDRLFGVCLKMVGSRGGRELAADCTQDAMVKVIEGLSSYDGRAKLSTWMIRVTMNVCLSKLRSEKLRRHASLDSMAEGPGAGGGRGGRGRDAGPEGRSGYDRIPELARGGGGGESGVGGEPGEGSGVEREELRRVLAEALLRVSPEQRAILVLRDSRGLDYEQIAEVLDVPVGTVKSRIFRARAALREVLEEMGVGENGFEV
jgi:RNA polymerase sigma-70 factor, ECF subfamily